MWYYVVLCGPVSTCETPKDSALILAAWLGLKASVSPRWSNFWNETWTSENSVFDLHLTSKTRGFSKPKRYLTSKTWFKLLVAKLVIEPPKKVLNQQNTWSEPVKTCELTSKHGYLMLFNQETGVYKPGSIGLKYCSAGGYQTTLLGRSKTKETEVMKNKLLGITNNTMQSSGYKTPTTTWVIVSNKTGAQPSFNT